MSKVIVSKDTVHYYFDAANKPVQRAKRGDTVVFDCMDCYANQIKSDETDFASLNMVTNNPMTGPLFVEGAQPGDILKVEIFDITVPGRGVMTARKGEGLYGDIIRANRCKVVPITDNKAVFNGIKIPLRPMVGGMGVAVEEPLHVTLPGPHGGNLDLKELTAGTVLFLPVFVEGALLSVGDVHAVQGDGETVICALEIDSQVTVKVDVASGKSIPLPFLETRDSYITAAEDESLDEAAKAAAYKMHEFLLAHTENLDVEEVAMLMSMAGDLRIAQVVNGIKGAYFKFPKDLLKINFSL